MEKTQPKLLVDTISYFDISKDFVQTQTEENGNIILTGILQRAEVPNQNGRIYPRHILEREVNKLLPLIQDNQITGQLDHPESAIVEFDTSAVKVVDIWWEGNDVMGKVQVLKGHPSGDKVISLLNNKVKVGISSRALGTITKASMYEAYKQYGDADVVAEDLNLITWDIVSNPSTHGAFLVTERMINEWNTQYINDSVKTNSYELTTEDKKLIYFINKYGSKDETN